ncbi:MBOAT family O-acyltransferase (plasmid) [Tistrella mobilis]|uniref:MBOAT family O-acyltransferase n=1 Tax=Tistrella mobilis TaxID=171437 RepID=UPI00355909F7
MLFQLPSFFVFLAAFAAGLALCPRRLVLAYVFLASLVFYAWWYPPYTALILGYVLAAWIGGRLVRTHPRLLPVTVVAVLLPLLLFKYTDFVMTTLEEVTGAGLPHIRWGLPLGVSFVTFSVISLLVDTAKNPKRPFPGFGIVAVYVTFFPHLIAGPILRLHKMVPRLSNIRIDRGAFTANAGLFAMGMMKKVLIADPVGLWVDGAIADPGQLGAIEAWFVMLGFAIQIYCDFSAYSDMAIGLAGMFGVAFPENFNRPYAATSMTEVWQRWHMTLSFWLRDYVYKYLREPMGRVLAILGTMVVSGLWHGAAWTFVVWGTIHGTIMMLEALTGHADRARQSRGVARAGFILATFGIWTVTATFFRAPTLEVALSVIAGGFGARGAGALPAEATLLTGLILVTLALHPLDTVDRIRRAVARVPAALALPVIAVLVAGCAMIAAGRPQAFFYFDF